MQKNASSKKIFGFYVKEYRAICVTLQNILSMRNHYERDKTNKNSSHLSLS